jgi:tetratricopeptide (TPR) repeat protein
MATQWTGNAAERLANATETLAIAAALGDMELEAVGRGHRGVAVGDTGGDVDTMRRDIDEMERVANALKDPVGRGLIAFPRAGLAIVEGRLTEAEALAFQGLRGLREAGDAGGLVLYVYVISVLRFLQGRLSEVIHLASAMLLVYPFATGPAHAFAAANYAMLGMHDEARRHLREADPRDPLSVPRNAGWLSTLAMMSLACARVGDRERAVILYELMLPHADAYVMGNGVGWLGPASFPLGVAAATAGMLEEAEGHFERALQVSTGNGWRLAIAYIQVHYATMLIARARDGDQARARTMAGAAAATAAELGLRIIARDAEDLLGVIAGTVSQRPAGAGAARGGVTRRDRFRSRITVRGRSAVARLTRDHTDEALARRFGSPLALRALFTAMAHAFQPAMAAGFEGAIAFELRPSHDGVDPAGSDWWTVEVRGRSASARRGRGDDPSLSLHVGLADFVRLLSGELNPIQAIVERRFDYEGDFLVAARLADMFGAVEPLDLPSMAEDGAPV